MQYVRLTPSGWNGYCKTKAFPPKNAHSERITGSSIIFQRNSSVNITMIPWQQYAVFSDNLKLAGSYRLKVQYIIFPASGWWMGNSDPESARNTHFSRITGYSIFQRNSFVNITWVLNIYKHIMVFFLSLEESKT